MNMSLWFDDEKDKVLIDWLKTKTNKSATIREALYDKINGIKIVSKEENIEFDDGFINSLSGFQGQD